MLFYFGKAAPPLSLCLGDTQYCHTAPGRQSLVIASATPTFLKLLCLLVPCSAFWLWMMSSGVSLSFSFRLSISVFSSLSCSCRCLLFSMYSTLKVTEATVKWRLGRRSVKHHDGFSDTTFVTMCVKSFLV